MSQKRYKLTKSLTKLQILKKMAHIVIPDAAEDDSDVAEADSATT